MNRKPFFTRKMPTSLIDNWEIEPNTLKVNRTTFNPSITGKRKIEYLNLRFSGKFLPV